MWILLTIAAAFIWSIVNFFDKHITEHKLPEMPRYYAFSAFGSAVLAVGVSVFTGFWLPSLCHLFLLLITGGAFAGMMWFYLKALKIEETSYVVPLFQIVPIWTAILGFYVLGESLIGWDFIAFIIIFLGGVILSIEKVSCKLLTLKPAFGLMLIATLFVAVMFVGFKYVLNIYPDHFWSLYALQLWGQVIVCALLAFFGWEDHFTKNIKSDLMKFFPLFFFNDFISFIAFGLYMWALWLAPVALVGALAGVQGLFVFLIGMFLTYYYPQLVEENISRRVVLQKLLGALILIFGVIVLQLF